MSADEPSRLIASVNPNSLHLIDNIRSCAARGLPVVEPGCLAKARGAVVCGTAPSLLKPSALRQIRSLAKRGFKVVALKEAIALLAKRGIVADYSVSVDPDAAQIAKTPLDRRVTYFVASMCDPALFDHVTGGGCKAVVFHTACGAQDIERGWAETDVYRNLFHPGARQIAVASGGYTVANRAVSLAVIMGCRRIYVAGCQFGWRDEENVYAAGATGMTLYRGALLNDGGALDGRTWHFNVNLLPAAADMSRRIRAGHVEMIGDSLATALAAYDDAFIEERVVKTVPMEVLSPPPEPQPLIPAAGLQLSF